MLTRLVTLHSSLTATATETLPRSRPEASQATTPSVPLDPLRPDELRSVVKSARSRWS
ncbi:MAG: hypothetical protein ABIJ09_04405 [Pseudomonadota bacterium]